MQRGFKAYAKTLALEIRSEIGLNPYERFDPYALAQEYGIPVYLMSDLAGECGRREDLSVRAGKVSAALVPVGNSRFIIENDTDTEQRRRNSVSHELGHLVLEHQFDTTLMSSDGCRWFDKEKEEEATWLGGELLIPCEAAKRAARNRWSDEEVAEFYNVSVQLATMRMNVSGARIIFERSRNRRPSRS